MRISGGQVGVERAAPLRRIVTPGIGHIGVGHLPVRVHPGVRAPGAVYRDSLAVAEFGESRLQPVLNRVAVRLALPTLERPTIVGHGHFQPPERRGGEVHSGARRKAIASR